MIKGVNKRIVEITSTQNDYFEKAVLYIRADKSTISDNRLELEARAFVGSILPPKKKEEKEKVPLAIKLVCSAAIVLSAVLLICLIVM